MKNYNNPILELVLTKNDDVLTASDPTVETTVIPSGNGSWSDITEEG